ncbi:hypothetical protein BU17DRAFT_103804 [Hysterangium stoloniferum]|nr:hypothetical protein BU17DRAFT_103804 [Hysterangium stoloniferum]
MENSETDPEMWAAFIAENEEGSHSVNDDNEDDGNSTAADEEPIDLSHVLVQQKNGDIIERIFKPSGCGGRNFNVRKAIGLRDDGVWYQDILTIMKQSVHRCTSKYIDIRHSIRDQSKRNLVKVEIEVLEDHPELEVFDGAWPIHALIRQYLKNTSERARMADKRRIKRLGTDLQLKKTTSGASQAHRNAKNKNKESHRKKPTKSRTHAPITSKTVTKTTDKSASGVSISISQNVTSSSHLVTANAHSESNRRSLSKVAQTSSRPINHLRKEKSNTVDLSPPALSTILPSVSSPITVSQPKPHQNVCPHIISDKESNNNHDSDGTEMTDGEENCESMQCAGQFTTKRGRKQASSPNDGPISKRHKTIQDIIPPVTTTQKGKGKKRQQSSGFSSKPTHVTVLTVPKSTRGKKAKAMVPSPAFSTGSVNEGR